ncbi:excalibur calcium-binding domain-containing protein [Paenibacillus terricola]|uniref:excalibur calcium-binding domain-containing protein n=1 Tax=Paenibacillus terricola TaxID=2763503 RepID=UPI00296491F8|nr:excalibur calcium-binding domain-containing protein [Paenibacillus terricola]
MDSTSSNKSSSTTTKPAVESNVSSTPASNNTNNTKTEVVYKNCTEVRAAGAAPLHKADPGYSRKLDRDGDGVACE